MLYLWSCLCLSGEWFIQQTACSTVSTAACELYFLQQTQPLWLRQSPSPRCTSADKALCPRRCSKKAEETGGDGDEQRKLGYWDPQLLATLKWGCVKPLLIITS